MFHKALNILSYFTYDAIGIYLTNILYINIGGKGLQSFKMADDFDVDSALVSLGRLGKWQMLSYLYLAMLMCSSACFSMLSVVFIGEYSIIL